MIFALLLCILPAEPWPVDTVDLVEVNTVIGMSPWETPYTQVIWIDNQGPCEIRDWRYFSDHMLPIGGASLFFDKGQLRAVKVLHPQVLRITTYYDIEAKRRKIQPLLFRRRLTDTPD